MHVVGLLPANLHLVTLSSEQISPFKGLRKQHVQTVNKTSSIKIKQTSNIAESSRFNRTTLRCLNVLPRILGLNF